VSDGSTSTLVITPAPDPDQSPTVTAVVPFAPTEIGNEAQMPPLLIAIKRTDYRTALNDRETAMAVRWVLQDIRSIDQGCHRSVRLIFRDCKTEN
jgi:hypothetical protein